MLCNLALRRSRLSDEHRYDLRIHGKTSLGPSGTGGTDVMEGLDAESVRSTLRALGMGEDVVSAAAEVIHDSRHTDRFVSIVDGVQIPYDVLERAHIDLFD